VLATPHMLAGAAVGKTIGRSWVALSVAFFSHFLLDFAPHIDSHRLFGIQDRATTGPEALGGTVDAFIGTILVLLLARRQRKRRLILGSAFAAVVIDLVDNVPPGSRLFRGWAGTAWLSQFHHGFQHNVPLSQWPLGFGTQAILVALALWVLKRAKWRDQKLAERP